MNETLFIINPASARGTTLRTWNEARRELLKLGVAFREHLTKSAGEATSIARQAILDGISRVVAVGGDGTLGEVVNGYFDSTGQVINREAALGLLPSGTGSDFRRSLGFKTRQDAISAIASSQTSLIDAGRIAYRLEDETTSSRFFINTATFGLGGDTARYVNQWRERLPHWIGGRARFIAAALFALDRYKNVPVEVGLDDGSHLFNSNFIVVANGRFGGGGMMLAPHAEIDDGLFDVIIADRATRFDIIKELPRIQRGGHLKNAKVSETQAREVSIVPDKRLAIELDGESIGYTPAQLSVLPSAIQFVMHQRSSE